MGGERGPAPALSVIIAAYNAQATLDAQLDVLARQHAELEWEILVCDNGSSDMTADLVRRRMTRIPNLRLVDASRRRGPGAARNVGAAASHARWLAFCDADDVVADDWVHQMSVALAAHPFVTGTSRRPELNSRPEDPRYFDWSLYRVPFFPFLEGAGSGNMGIHKSVFDEVGGFDESLRTGEDLDLCWRVQLAGHPLVAHPAAVVNVSNRANLRASFAQAFAYGVGDRRLRHKYARVVEAYRREDEVGTPPPVPDSSETSESDMRAPDNPESRRHSAMRRIVQKVLRLRRLSDLTDATHRAASSVGFHVGTVYRRSRQITPPRDLPEPRRGPI